MHFVGLALQIVKKPLDAKPVLAPFAIPVRRAIDHPAPLFRCELVPGRVTRYACSFCMAHQIVLCFFPCWSLHDLHSARTQRELVVRNYQTVVHTNHAAKSLAGGAGTHGGVKREQRRRWVCVAGVTVRAMQACGEAPHLFFSIVCALNIHIQTPSTTLDSDLNRFHSTRFFNRLNTKPVGDDVQQFVRSGGRCDFALRMYTREATGR